MFLYFTQLLGNDNKLPNLYFFLTCYTLFDSTETENLFKTLY